MQRNRKLRGAALGAALLCTLGSAAAQERPNILLILADDQGWSQVSRAADPELPESRSSYLETPHIDGLARAGLTFTSGYAPSAHCTPTRRSILCGTSAARSGTEFKSAWVPAEHLTLPGALKLAHPDYRCAHFGKWGGSMGSDPDECGYDVSDGRTANRAGGTQDKHLTHVVEDPKRTSSVTERAVGFLREQAASEQPFFMQVSYYAVHLRVELTQPTLDRFTAKGAPDRRYTAGWAGMLAELDEAVGELLGALDELGLADNTYVFYLSDNGCWPTMDGADPARPTANQPLTEGKQTLFEGGVRVPFIVRGPGIEPDSHCRVPVIGYDLLPTFYDLARGTESLSAGLDGASLRPLLSQPAAPTAQALRRTAEGLIFHRPIAGRSAIRQGDHKLWLYTDRRGAVTSRRLFDLSSDPAETRDLAARESELADRLQQVLTEYLREVDAEVPADFGAARQGPR